MLDNVRRQPRIATSPPVFDAELKRRLRKGALRDGARQGEVHMRMIAQASLRTRGYLLRLKASSGMICAWSSVEDGLRVTCLFKAEASVVLHAFLDIMDAVQRCSHCITE